MTEKMKPSGIKSIGEIPCDWKISKIKYNVLIPVTDGPHETPVFVEDGVPFYSVDGIQNDHLVYEPCRYISYEDANRYDTKVKPQYGDILMGKAASVGKIALIDKHIRLQVWSPLAIIRTNETKIHNKYLRYYLLSDSAQIEIDLKSTTNTQKNIAMEDIENLVITVPSIEEQKKITYFLDAQCAKIDSIIADIEKQIETLQKHKKSLITETVTKGLDKSVPMKDSGIECIGNIPIYWSVKRVKYVIDSIKDGTHGTFDRVDTGEYLLSAKNVFDDGIRIGQNESEISVTDYKSIVANGYPQRSDVLLCCVGTVGRCCVYEFDKPYAFQRSVSFLRPLSSTDSFFLQFALQSNSTLIQEQLLINKSAQDGLYMGSVRELIIAIPNSIEEQKSISEFLKTKVAHIDELIVNKEQQLETIKQHKKSLIYEYVTGKKRVTEVN